jgi:hypothetical protein
MSDDQQQFDGGKSGSALKIVLIIIVALLGLGSCCGVGILGVFYFVGPNASEGMVLQRQIQGTPVIQTYIGQLDDLGVDAAKGRVGFDVSGSKGSGRLLVETGKGTLANADWAVLMVDESPSLASQDSVSAETTRGSQPVISRYVVFGEPPADMGAEIFPDTGNASTDDMNNDVDDSNQ